MRGRINRWNASNRKWRIFCYAAGGWKGGKFCLVGVVEGEVSPALGNGTVDATKSVMLEGIYTNAASLSAMEKWQSVVSQNIAASNVAGFKKTDFAIESDPKKKTQFVQDEFGGAKNTGFMPTRTTSINFSNGDHKPTGKPTDFAIDGDGFFQVRGADGQPLFTRDGEFQFNQNNTLVTKDGLEVVGDDGPITYDPEQGAFTVARDGTITQGDNAIGRLSVYEIENPKLLTRVSAGITRPLPIRFLYLLRRWVLFKVLSRRVTWLPWPSLSA